MIATGERYAAAIDENDMVLIDQDRKDIRPGGLHKIEVEIEPALFDLSPFQSPPCAD